MQVRPTNTIGRVLPYVPINIPGREHYDLVLTYPHQSGSSSEESNERRVLMARMRFIGLEIARDLSRDADEVLLKLAAPDALLEETAEYTTMEKRLKAGGYTAFTRDTKKLFVPAGASSFFSSLERQRLVLQILELDLAEGGCDLELDVLLERGIFSAVVPVHEALDARKPLMDSWCLAPLRWWPDQPLDDIKDYFGERLTLYFAFVQHLTRALLLPSAVGAIVIGYGFMYGSVDNPLTPVYSLFMMLWLPSFAKSWRLASLRASSAF